MFVTRRAEFSASHVCRLPHLTDEQNHALYGEGASRNGHGHNYVVEVTVEGDPDPLTGMVLNLKDLKDILEHEVVGPMDHRFLNYEVEPFSTVVPTIENVASEIWRRLEKRLSTSATNLAKVRLCETPDLFVDVHSNSALPRSETKR